MANINHSRCQFCSLGCGYGIEVHHGEALSLEYDGPLCSRGNYLLELINHPLRLTGTSIGGLPASAETALSAAAPRIRREETGATVIVLAPDASDEDILTARTFADRLGTQCMVAVDDPAGDLRVMRALHDLGLTGGTPTFNDISRAKVIVALGDPFEAGPVIAGPVLDAKYTHGRDMTFTVMDAIPNRTARFAGTFIGGTVRKNAAALLVAVIRLAGDNRPAWASQLPASLQSLDSPGIGTTAAALTGQDEAIILVDTADPAAAALAALIRRAAGPHVQCRLITSYGNAAGFIGTGAADATMEDVIAQSADSGIATLIVLGADLKRNPAYDTLINSAGTVIAASPFPNRTTQTADIVLPAALVPEYAGTWGDERLEPVIPPPGGARGYGDILGGLAHTMGMHLDTPEQPEMRQPAPDEEKIAAFLASLPGVLDSTPPAVFSRNTITRCTDGALTDMMSWTAAQTREAW